MPITPDDMGPLPRIHEREVLCIEAAGALSLAVSEWRKEYDKLTPTEALSIIAGELNDRVSSALKYAIRHERHGDTNKPGGTASD